MDAVSGVVVFLLTWWMVLFMVLPFGLKRDEDGTPANPNLRRKLLITTGASIVIWIVIYFLIEADLISFAEIAAQMAQDNL